MIINLLPNRAEEMESDAGRQLRSGKARAQGRGGNAPKDSAQAWPLLSRLHIFTSNFSFHRRPTTDITPFGATHSYSYHDNTIVTPNPPTQHHHDVGVIVPGPRIPRDAASPDAHEAVRAALDGPGHIPMHATTSSEVDCHGHALHDRPFPRCRPRRLVPPRGQQRQSEVPVRARTSTYPP